MQFVYSKIKRNTGNTVHHGEEEYSWKTVKKTMSQQHRSLAVMRDILRIMT